MWSVVRLKGYEYYTYVGTTNVMAVIDVKFLKHILPQKKGMNSSCSFATP